MYLHHKNHSTSFQKHQPFLWTSSITKGRFFAHAMNKQSTSGKKLIIIGMNNPAKVGKFL